MSLDCRQVHGLDATSAQTFGTLWTMLERLGVELVITHLDNPEMERLLRAHGVIDDTHCACVPTNPSEWSQETKDPTYTYS